MRAAKNAITAVTAARNASVVRGARRGMTSSRFMAVGGGVTPPYSPPGGERKGAAGAVERWAAKGEGRGAGGWAGPGLSNVAMNLVLLEPEDFVTPGRARLRGARVAYVRAVHRARAGDRLRVGE